jgi:hypothetical protein
MSRKELIKEIRKHTGCDRKKIRKFLEELEKLCPALLGADADPYDIGDHIHDGSSPEEYVRYKVPTSH